MEKGIKLKDLGIVSIAMDPENPRTKFDKKLKKAIPAGEIYQLAFFNKSCTKFMLLADIVKNKQDVYEINSTTYYRKLKDIYISYKPFYRYAFDPIDVPCYYNFFNSPYVLTDVSYEAAHDDEYCFPLNFLSKNNDRFVSAQMKEMKNEMKRINYLRGTQGECLEDNF